MMGPPVQRAPAGVRESEEIGLLHQIAGRDRGAFDRLYRIYYRRLARFLEHIVRHPHLIEEIVNDTMLVVWTSAGRFNQASRVSTWIFGIAYKTALRALRRTGRVQETDEDYDIAVSDATPEHLLAARQRQQRITQALGTLSREQRAVVELTYYHGCPYHEIAEILGCPVDTVKTRMFHARRKLKPLLGQEE
jgi:RNA polymerase sigma factor (sigma-70 family)